MKPWSRSKVVLVSSAVLWACSGDPTDSFRGGPAEVTVTPTSLFIERGETKQVIVEVIDEQGNPLVEDVTVSGGTGLTITEDPTHLQTTATSSEPSHERAFNVTANELVSTTFTVSGGGKTADVSVRTTPPAAEIPLATVAATGPNPTDPATLTVPAPYQFPVNSAITWIVGADTLIAVVTGRSEDGRSLTILAPPGVTTAPTTADIVIDYLPTTILTTTTDVPFTVSTTATPLAGTNDPATAPTINLIGGVQGGVIDGNGGYAAATCGGNSGAPCQLYKFTLDADTELDVLMKWSNEADLGLYLMTADGLTDIDDGFCDGLGRGPVGTGQPEHCALVLPAGTYLAGIVNFGPFYPENDPNPDWVYLRMTAVE
jgi:hypothetical protein